MDRQPLEPENKPASETRPTELTKEPAPDKTGLLALIFVIIALVVLYFVFKPQPPATVPAVTTPPAVTVTPQTNETTKPVP